MPDRATFYQGLFEAQRRQTHVLLAGLEDLEGRLLALERAVGVPVPERPAASWTIEGALRFVRFRLGMVERQAAHGELRPGRDPLERPPQEPWEDAFRACTYCQQPFLARSSTQKTCSPTHQRLQYPIDRRAREETGEIVRARRYRLRCRWCRVAYDARGPSQLACSPEHRRQLALHGEPPPEDRHGPDGDGGAAGDRAPDRPAGKDDLPDPSGGE